ncbi:hypothetical protein [Stenotrophomonas rhizophila]|uniref:hypothetical protein n=1 Tax=Stenotrophomonas rhizophila TaxID=216778 RepID=UPI00081C9AEE|nr:hypothetical protein [Stenotrophomonas rhizophila]AOA73096.1 hypothetical protein BAY15_2662 [Stenotrophomonas rhizophila]
MKKMLWLLLAAMPMQAVANEEDPIAYKCYYCTPDEMEEVALAQGVGKHYLYDASKMTITGHDVRLVDGTLKADSFTAEDWVKTQFLGMMKLYDGYTGDMSARIEDVSLFAPGTEHGRGYSYLWGHHLSSLNPTNPIAREYVYRYLAEHPDLKFLDTSTSGGKLLRFEYMLGGEHPITAQLQFIYRKGLHTLVYFDHKSRQWQYLGTESPYQPSIQDRREDFAPSDGDWTFRYSRTDNDLAQAFIERALWAKIPVHGQLPIFDPVQFTCKRAADDIQCYIE